MNMGRCTGSTSATKGILTLCKYYPLPSDRTKMDWIYSTYQELIQQDLCNIKQLQAKGLHDIIDGMSLYWYEGVHQVANKMTSKLLYSLTSRRHRYSTQTVNAPGSERFRCCLPGAPFMWRISICLPAEFVASSGL